MFNNATFLKVFNSYSYNIYSLLFDDIKCYSIADKIIRLRSLKGMNQRKFAKIINKGFTSVYNWEAGNINPSIDSLNLILNLFNLPENYFDL